MDTHYVACAKENESILAAAIVKVSRYGLHNFSAWVKSDDDVVRAAIGRDFGFLLPKSELSLHRIADGLQPKMERADSEPLSGAVPVGYSPLVFLMNPAAASRLQVEQHPFGWIDLAAASLKIRHASARQIDGETVALARHLALASSENEQRVQQQVEEYGPDDREVLQRAVAEGWKTDLVIAQERSVLDFAKQQDVEGVIVYPHDGTLAVPTSFALAAGWYGEDSEGAFAHLAEALQATSRATLAATGLHRSVEDMTALPNLPGAGGLQWAPHAGVKTVILPGRRAVKSIRELALKAQRAVDVCLVFDSSESMREGGKFDAAVLGVEAFLALLGSPTSRLGLIRIRSRAEIVVPLTAKSQFHFDPASLQPEGRTALTDAVGQALAMLTEHGYSSNIRAIVGFTDGQENASFRLGSAVESAFRAHPGIRFYGIAYGADADASSLERFAAASDGLVVKGGTAQIKALYERLSTYF